MGAANKSCTVSSGREGWVLSVITLASVLDTQTNVATKDWKFLVAACGILILAGALRLYHIGTQELWIDESISYHIVTSPNGREVALRESTPPLYFIFLRAWISLAGTTEAGLRSFSALCGVLFIAALIAAGRALFNTSVGLWSGSFAAVSPIHIYYSQEARTYTLLTLWLVLTYAALWRALRKGTWAAWFVVAVCALLALYSHYYSVLALIPTVLLVHWWSDTDSRNQWIRYGVIGLLCFVLFIPWVLLNFSLIAYPMTRALWVEEFWRATPPLLAVPKSLEAMAFGMYSWPGAPYMKQFTEDESFPPSIRYWGIAVLCLVGFIALIPWGDKRLAISEMRRRKLWVVTLILFPLLVFWIVSFYRPHYIVGRYDMVIFPAYALLIGIAFAKLQALPKGGVVATASIALLLLVPITGKLMWYYTAPPLPVMKYSSRTTAQILELVVTNGEAVALQANRGLAPLYYLQERGYQWANGSFTNLRTAGHFVCRIFPSEVYELLFDIDHPNRVLYSDEVVRHDLREMISQLESSTKVVWVLFQMPLHKILLEELTRLGFFHRPDRDLPDLGILVFERI